MARPGAPRHKVLSSGRLTGTAKLTNGRKQIGLRKACHSDVDSGYSLYSTDSEDQVATIHNGLDRCAALLKGILQNEATGKETVHQKPGRATSVKAVSRPLVTRGNTSKRKGLKKNLLAAPVHKEVVPGLNRKLTSSARPAEREGELSSAVQNQPVQPTHVPFSQPSPVMHQKLCEHVQTQMALITGQASRSCNGISSVPPCPVSDHGYQNVTAFNYRLPTSTPSLSPQHPANPSTIQSGLPPDGCNQCASHVGGTVFFPGVSAAAPTAQVQSVTTGPGMLPCVPPAMSNNAPAPMFLPSSGNEMLPSQGNQEQRAKEAELIRCIQAHLALLQPHEAENNKGDENHQNLGPAPSQSLDPREEETAAEYSGGTTSEEEDLNMLDIAPVRDTSCQTSFEKKVLKPKKESPEKTAQKVKTVKYLLGELKALVEDQDDSEILRLISEINGCVSLLPAVVGSTNVQAEIALALQPLRSENAQLRRRVRILNQQLRERQRAEKESSQDCHFEFSLQSLNTTLQSQLKESLKGLESLQNKNEELLKIIESQKEENKQFAKVIQEKDKELLENKQQFDIQATKLKIEVDEALGNVKNFQFKLEASEKENQILGITLRQRDAEVNRLRELTRTLQGSMAKLLSDLTVDSVRHRPGKGLTKSLLEVYEKQMQTNPFPVSTSIMSYLKNLETDCVWKNEEPQLSHKIGELEMPRLAREKLSADGSPKKTTVFGEEIPAPRVLPPLSKEDGETISDSGTLIEEEHKVDETIYIPLTSSASKKQPLVTEKRICTQHQINAASKKLDCSCGLSDFKKQNDFGILDDAKIFDKFTGGYNLKKTTENASEATRNTARLEGDRLQTWPKDIMIGAAKGITDEPDRPQSDKHPYAPMPHKKESFQKPGSEISADSSFSVFDCMAGKSEWSASSFSTFTSRDEEDFKNGLAALDANIARLQRTLHNSMLKQ